jgi:hypothetical protein
VLCMYFSYTTSAILQDGTAGVQEVRTQHEDRVATRLGYSQKMDMNGVVTQKRAVCLQMRTSHAVMMSTPAPPTQAPRGVHRRDDGPAEALER